MATLLGHVLLIAHGLKLYLYLIFDVLLFVMIDLCCLCADAAHMEQEESLVWSYLVSFTGLGLKSSLGSRLGPIKTSNRT